MEEGIGLGGIFRRTEEFYKQEIAKNLPKIYNGILA